MHNLFASWGIFLLLIFSIGGIANNDFYANNTYEVKQIGDLLHNAQSTTDLSEKARHMSLVLAKLSGYNGNPEWLYPTDSTNFDSIKATLSTMIMKTIELDQRVDVDAMSYQQNLSVVDTTIDRIHDRIHYTGSSLQGNIYDNPLNWMTIFVSAIVGFIVLIIVDYANNKRQGKSWYL